MKTKNLAGDEWPTGQNCVRLTWDLKISDELIQQMFIVFLYASEAQFEINTIPVFNSHTNGEDA